MIVLPSVAQGALATAELPELVLQELDEAVSRAFGQGGEPGPVYLDFPVDTLRAEVPRALQLPEQLAPKPSARMLPDPDAVQQHDVTWRRSGEPLQRMRLRRARPVRVRRALRAREKGIALDGLELERHEPARGEPFEHRV